jgi:hypothetical protein
MTQDELISNARQCARLFRLGRDIEAALDMVTLIDMAMPMVSPSHQAEWTRVLGSILQCQERQDWMGVADWLEVEFVALCLSPDSQTDNS